jgi:hypothetical protein
MDPDDKTDNSATDATTGSLSTNHHDGHISDFQNHKEQTASRFEAVENRRKEDREDHQRRADQAKDNFNDVIARAIDTTEKRIAASETAYLTVIAANMESSYAAIAATEKTNCCQRDCVPKGDCSQQRIERRSHRSNQGTDCCNNCIHQRTDCRINCSHQGTQ